MLNIANHSGENKAGASFVKREAERLMASGAKLSRREADILWRVVTATEITARDAYEVRRIAGVGVVA